MLNLTLVLINIEHTSFHVRLKLYFQVVKIVLKSFNFLTTINKDS